MPYGRAGRIPVLSPRSPSGGLQGRPPSEGPTMISTASLESYARRVWPVQRLFANVARRCARCIVSERYTPLESGLCSECRTAGAQAPDQAEESEVGLEVFTRDVEAYCGTGANGYDALLLLSGGKDSAFILH